MNKGKEFEELVALIERSVYRLQKVKVEHNVKMRTRYGKERQIDILISDERDERFVFKTIIECKNKGHKVDLNTVGAFKELVQSVNAHQGIIVSAAGFQAGAIESAKEMNILLYELSKPMEIENHFRDKKFGYHELRHKSKNIVVRFLEKKPINREVTFYSELYVSALNRNVKMVDVVQLFLDQNHQKIFDDLFKKSTDVATVQSIPATIELTINFPSSHVYSNKRDQTVITGFSAEIETELFLAPTEVRNMLAYTNIADQKTYACIYQLDYEGTQFNWVEKKT